MTSRNYTPIRAPGQRSIPSTFNQRLAHQCSSNHSGLPSDKNKRGSNLSLNNFLNRKLHTTSVLPFNKDEKAFSVAKNENVPLAADCNPRNVSTFRDKQYVCRGPHNERGLVIEDSVFKLFNDSKGKVRKRSTESLTATSRLEGVSKQHNQNHLLVLGDDPKPKRRAPGGVSCNYKKQRPLYNHYENGTGFWEPEREGIDCDEVGSTVMWEGMCSTTTLRGLDELSNFDQL